MGFFVSEEERLPYDVHGLMACIAPRPLAVISPKLDREANIADVTEAVEAARAAYDFYDVTDSIIQLSPEDYNHFGMKMQALVIEAISRWIQR